MAKVTIKFIPKTVTGEEATADQEAVAPTMRGHVVVRAPMYHERLKYQSEFAKLDSIRKTLESKQVTPEEKAEAGVQSFEILAEMVKEAHRFIESVELELLDGSAKASSADELMCFPEFETVAMELGMGLVRGFRGNLKGQSGTL